MMKVPSKATLLYMEIFLQGKRQWTKKEMATRSDTLGPTNGTITIGSDGTHVKYITSRLEKLVRKLTSIIRGKSLHKILWSRAT